MDSQMARSGVIEAVRNVDADYLIRAPDDGAVSDLLDDATTDQPEWETNLPFSDFSSARRPNAFAYPISSEEVGGQNQKRDHKAFLTDMKVNDRDLRGLAYQYRSRWRIETAIRQLKNRFHPRTRAADGEIRTWFFATAALFYNLYSYVNTVVPGNLGVLSRDAHLSGEEFLHVFRKGEFVGHLHT
jgi:IS4 transposase